MNKLYTSIKHGIYLLIASILILSIILFSTCIIEDENLRSAIVIISIVLLLGIDMLALKLGISVIGLK